MADILFLEPTAKPGLGRAPASALAGGKLTKIALIGNYPPRRCGIATFTADTRDALVAAQPDVSVDVYAMDDGRGTEPKSDHATHIPQDDPKAYHWAAQQINGSGAQVVWLQHEFGIFGGPDGSLVLDFVGQLAMPLVVTLHTVLDNPTPNQDRIVTELVAKASLVIVMANRAREILQQRYGLATHKITVIAHGIPDRPYIEPDRVKAALGLAGRDVVLTFGLLSPDKGIGDMIEAMPAIVKARPNALYVILGATHPHIIVQSGEALRDKLQAQAIELGVADHVRFIDAYVDLDLLTQYLQAADIYVTPYRNPGQITSGTLSYAVGLGKPVISTRYIHAEELLGDGTGVLVPFRDPAALGREISALLDDKARRDQIARRAYRAGRSMTWENYARAALGQFTGLLKPVEAAPSTTPIVGLSAIERLTDDTGMFQHSRFGVPDRNHGYCIDDNARALALVSAAQDMPATRRTELAMIFAGFIQHAWNPDVGHFRNFMGFDRRWLESAGSEDSNGRALWALAQAAARNPSGLIREWAGELYREASLRLVHIRSPRAVAFALLAAAEMERAGLGTAHTQSWLPEAATGLLGQLRQSQRPDWNWFEQGLAYDNCRMPEALITSGNILGDDEMIRAGLDALDWIMHLQIGEQGYFRPVGSESFGMALARPLPFDQQPVEALAAIDACIAAAACGQSEKWRDWGEAAYAWFTGANDLRLAVADVASGECCDGLTRFGCNANRGAESILAWQMSARRIVALRKAFASNDKPLFTVWRK